MQSQCVSSVSYIWNFVTLQQLQNPSTSCNMKKAISTLLIAMTALFTANAQTSDTLSINGSVGKLFTIINRPAQTGKVPLVILCHGFSGNCERPFIKDLSKSIVEQGMATLRFDFNGHGKSDGEFKNMTVVNEIDDLKSVITWAQHQPWVKDISLVGHSQGGVVVSMVSGELGYGIIKAEVLLAAAAVLRDDALRGNTMGAIYNPWNFKGDYIELPHSPEAGALLLGKNYVETAMSLPIYDTAANYTGPTLIVQGTHDRIVPYTYAERYKEKISKSELKLIPDENHMFSRTQKETSVFVADWLHSVLL